MEGAYSNNINGPDDALLQDKVYSYVRIMLDLQDDLARTQDHKTKIVLCSYG